MRERECLGMGGSFGFCSVWGSAVERCIWSTLSLLQPSEQASQHHRVNIYHLLSECCGHVNCWVSGTGVINASSPSWGSTQTFSWEMLWWHSPCLQVGELLRAGKKFSPAVSVAVAPRAAVPTSHIHKLCNFFLFEKYCPKNSPDEVSK